MKNLLIAALAALTLSACGPELAAYRDFDYAPRGPMQYWKVAICGRYGETEWRNEWATFAPPSYDCYGRVIAPTVISGVPYTGGVLVIMNGRVRMPFVPRYYWRRRR